MKLSSQFKPEVVCGKDPSRPMLHDLFLDTTNAEAPMLVALDGHCLVAVPVTLLEGEEQGVVKVDAVKAARKLAQKGEDVVLGGGHPDDFPPWRQFLPAYREGSPETFTVRLDVKLLAKLVEALDCDNKQDGNVSLTFKVDDPLGPIVVCRGWDARAFGVLMPCRR